MRDDPLLLIIDHEPSPDRFRLGWRNVEVRGTWSRPTEVATAFEALFSESPDSDLPWGEMGRPWVFMSIDCSRAKIRSTAELQLAIYLARIARCGQARIALVGSSARVEHVVLRLLSRWRSPALYNQIYISPSSPAERS
jgi:hypothetical protein